MQLLLLVVDEKARDIKEGIEKSREAINSGLKKKN